MPEPLSYAAEAFGHVLEPLSRVPEPFSQLPEPLSYVSKSLGYMSESLSHVPESLSHVPEFPGYVREPLGYVLKPLVHVLEPFARPALEQSTARTLKAITLAVPRCCLIQRRSGISCAIKPLGLTGRGGILIGEDAGGIRGGGAEGAEGSSVQ